MKTVFTVLTLAFVSFAFLSGAFAVSSGTGAIGFIQADQCDTTTFYGCAKVFFSNFGQPLPIANDASFLKLFEDYLLANKIAGLKNTCQWLATFDSCSSHNCWTAANFKSLGVQESDYFATVFKAAFNLCNSDDVKFLLQDGGQCLSSISEIDQLQFLGCISGLISGAHNYQCVSAVTELIVRRKCVHCTLFSHNLRLRNIFSYYRVSKELAAMKNVSTVLVLVLASLTLLHGSFAVSSDAGAIGVIQADQCDPNKLRTCVTSLFAGFGQGVPPDTNMLINLLTNYILSNGISALSNIC
uniref:Transmembrane protein n=1 Tax=Plectus sambesii TaxID=2011161 RepID=A0A914XLR7_9BILA